MDAILKALVAKWNSADLRDARPWVRAPASANLCGLGHDT